MISISSDYLLPFSFHRLHIVVVASIKIIHSPNESFLFSGQIGQFLLKPPFLSFSMDFLTPERFKLISQLPESVHVGLVLPLQSLQFFSFPLEILLDLSCLSLYLISESLCIPKSPNDALLFGLKTRDFITHLLIELSFITKLVLEVAVYSLLEGGCFFKFSL